MQRPKWNQASNGNAIAQSDLTWYDSRWKLVLMGGRVRHDSGDPVQHRRRGIFQHSRHGASARRSGLRYRDRCSVSNKSSLMLSVLDMVRWCISRRHQVVGANGASTSVSTDKKVDR